VPTIRSARWPEDTARLAELDTSFTTDRVYRVVRDDLAFRLVPTPVDPPLRRSYDLTLADLDELRRLPHVTVAEEDGTLLGLAAADVSAWNRRVHVVHLYVAPRARRRGVGRSLMDAAIVFARGVHARCVWLETQDVNYPAVQCYRRLGFRLCGLDERLYDPRAPRGTETALFFALDLAT